MQISERTKAAMAAKKERGEPVGRPRQISEATRQRMIDLRSEGLGWKQIAQALTDEGHKPPRGRSRAWATSTIRKVCA